MQPSIAAIGIRKSGVPSQPEMFTPDCQVLRTRLINHILKMKKIDQDYARQALKDYDKLLPWLGLVGGVREALL